MSIETALYALLNNAAGVVGEVHYEDAPQNAQLPYLVFSQDDHGQDYYLGGTKSAVRNSDFEIICYGESSIAAATLADQVVAVLDDYTGTPAGGSPPCTEVFTKVRLQNYFDAREPQSKEYYRSLSFSIGYR